MHDSRISTALRQLNDLGPAPGGSRWRWHIATVEDVGRIVLPVPARRALGLRSGNALEIRGRSHRVALILRRSGDDGGGVPMGVDGRGRLSLPAWLRQATAASGSVLVGTCADPVLVVVTPVGVLDGLGSRLVGESR